MPSNIFPNYNYNRLRIDTSLFPQSYYAINNLCQKPPYEKMQQMIEELRSLGVKHLPASGLEANVKNEKILMGALLFWYHSKSKLGFSDEEKKVSKELFTNEHMTADSRAIVSCYPEYHNYLISNPKREPNLSVTCKSLQTLMNEHMESAIVINSHLKLLGFIRIQAPMLDDFYKEIHDAIEAMIPLIEQQVREHNTLDYLDMLFCLEQIKPNHRVLYFMKEYFIPKRAHLFDWQEQVRHNAIQCNERILKGMYLMALEKDGSFNTASFLQKTLNVILDACQYNKDTDRKACLEALLAFISRTELTLSTNPWNDKSAFIAYLDALCKAECIEIKRGREQILIDMQACTLSRKVARVARVAYCDPLGVIDFLTITNGIRIGQRTFDALIKCLGHGTLPRDLLLQGLLIEGRIPVFASHTGDLEKYREKRIHDAICLYVSAASREGSLKPIVDWLLMDIRSTTPYPSVRAHLEQYGLPPSSVTRQIPSSSSVKGILFFKQEEMVPVELNGSPSCSSSAQLL